MLLLLAYLGAAGYYLFVRVVTAWDLGNQAWWVGSWCFSGFCVIL
jgi:hypothetical protein